MKHHSLTLPMLMLGFLAALPVCQAIEIRDAVTAEELQKQYETSSKVNPFAESMKLAKLDGEDPTKTNKVPNLIDTSDFLSFGGLTTLVPKRAIIHIPKNYRDRIQFVKGSRIVVWPDFYVANRGWIKTLEVTREQAMGTEPFDEKVAENIEKSSVVVVAVYKGGPISVLPQKKPEEESTKTDKTNPSQP